MVAESLLLVSGMAGSGGMLASADQAPPPIGVVAMNVPSGLDGAFFAMPFQIAKTCPAFTVASG